MPGMLECFNPHVDFLPFVLRCVVLYCVVLRFFYIWSCCFCCLHLTYLNSLISSCFCFCLLLFCFAFTRTPREGEDRTGALLADREAAQYELSARTAELDRKEAVLEEGKERAAAEAKEKVCP